ncbi:hypothetical protein LL033_09975 [Clostridium estertheticum]|uniref:hypothetical protein n=1 Tax=Clostridium estertheticum TaxID=238834 RepID=UPI001C0D9568|nr:hypothetical protein [Clostridium estertheticum]MBU3217796.1 hypothetical protein [Clostridium estertheticum]WAG57483.1 hypothetical protein LL033_09975 [Clostridium estertheticum]
MLKVGKGEQVLILKESSEAQQDIVDKAQAKIDAHNEGPTIEVITEEVLNYSWGKPTLINKITTASGINEQWVYEFKYLWKISNYTRLEAC